MNYIANAFSLSMLPGEHAVHLRVLSTTADYVRGRLVGAPYESFVGHAGTARLFSAVLGIEVVVNRSSLSLSDPNDRLIVGQYVGPRLPEGATSLPDGAVIRWFQITWREPGVLANPMNVIEGGFYS